ncbi:MAG: trigger factor [Planctomycetota bacterium]
MPQEAKELPGAANAAAPLKTTLEDAGPCRKRLSVEVPVERVKETFEKNYVNLCENAVLPGFRKGHAPRKLVEKRFSKDVEEDVKSGLVADTFRDIVEEKKIDVLGEPKVEEVTFDREKPFAYKIVFEVRPEFALPEYASLALKKPDLAVTDAQVEKAIQNLRERLASWDVVAGGAAGEGDLVIVDCTVTANGQVVLAEKNVPHRAGSDNLAGLPVADLAGKIIGAKAGDALTLPDVTLPDNFKKAAFRKAKAEVALTILEVKRAKLPEVTEEWAKGVGFESVANLRDELKKDLEGRLAQAVEEALDEQVREKILAAVSFDLPEQLLASEAEDILMRRQIQLLSRGVPAEAVEKEMEALRTQSKDAAVRALKLFFVFDRIAKEQKVFATEEEVNARIEAIAARYQKPVDKVREDLSKKGSLAEIRNQLREEKVIKIIREKAKVA